MINIYQSGEKECTIVSRDKNKNRTFETIRHTNYFYVKDANGEFVSLWNDKLRKIEVKNYNDLVQKTKFYPETFEGDIPFVNRVLIDKIKDFGNPDLRIYYFDIENMGSSDTENTPEPITCICGFDNFFLTEYGFIWHPKFKTEKITKKIIVKINNEDKEIEQKTFRFNNEIDMLNKFIKFINDFDFDLITGWYSNGFDVPYIINRCNILGCEINKISMSNKINLKLYGNSWKINIDGRYSFDLIDGYKNLMFQTMDSFSLNDVAKEEISDAKIDVTQYNWKKLWEENPDLLIEYCYQDAFLVYRIDEKRGIIKYNDVKRKLIGCKWDDLWEVAKFHDIICLKEAHKINIVLPSKNKNKRMVMEGAIVQTPKPGINTKVICVDLKSLYPYIILTFNLSPENIDKNGDIHINNLNIDSKKKGLITHIVRYYLDERERCKKIMKQFDKGTQEYDFYYKSQYGDKIIVNSIFGALAFPGFRLFKPEIADTILYAGREIITWSKEKIKEYGYEVVYGDTDSIFLKSKKDLTFDECEKEGMEVAKKLTESYHELVTKFGNVKSQLEMQYEKTFSKIFFGCGSDGKATKKRYAGYLISKDKKTNEWKEDFNAMGFETKRSDTSKIEQIILQKVFEMILHDSTKTNVDNFINGIKEDIKNGYHTYEEFALRRGISKISHKDIYTNALHYGNNYLGCNFSVGSKIKMLFIKSMPKGFAPTKTLAFEHEDQIPEGIEIDWNKTFERMIDKKLERIYIAMGWETSKTKNKNILEKGQVKLF
jgi:DNA polymerase elongation subunit (family B)